MSLTRELTAAIVLITPLLVLGSAWGYRGYIPLNGSFERYDEYGNPPGWNLVAEPGTGGNSSSLLTDRAWRGSRALYLECDEAGRAYAQLAMPILFSDLRMLHTHGGEFYYKAVSSGDSGSNLIFRIDLIDKSGEVVATHGFSPPSDHVGDYTWHRHHFKVDIFESRMARSMNIIFSVNGGGSGSPGAWMVDELQVYEIPANLTVGTLKSQRALLRTGEVFQIRFELANEGGGNYYGFQSTIAMDDGLNTVDGLTVKGIDVIEPGVDYEMTWSLRAERPDTYLVEVSTQSDGDQKMMIIVGVAEFSHPAVRPPDPRITTTVEEITIENSEMRIVFPSLGKAGLFAVQCWDGCWRDMGVAIPMGHLLQLDDGGNRELLLLKPQSYRTSCTGGVAILSLEGSVRDGDGVDWDFSYEYSLTSGSSHVEVRLSVVAGEERRLLRLSGPQVLGGEGSFGSSRDQGIFCGLEYLAEGEISSGTDFVWEPGNLRTVPHPLKVTVPLMAIEEGNSTIALSWDPLEKWDGENQLPSARFVSPNWVQGQDNHFMSVFVPTVPGWVRENEHEAQTPYLVSSPLTLTAKIFARSDSGILEAFSWWLDENGVPAPPEKPRSYWDTVDLSTTCYKDICWVPESRAWKHTHLDDPRWIFWDTLVALPLWHHSALTTNMTLREEIREQVTLAMGGLGGWAGLDLALHTGNVNSALSSGYHTARSLADSQRDDGSWPFTPDAAHEFLGTPGDTSSGWVAGKARLLLKFGRITGDPEAIAAGFKALEYLDTQARPEGAQTWELQLHVPDVLASSYIMECYLEAYRITGRREYLEKARYWALTGLPFIYMWNPPDRPVMRYGSIPVFGATSYVSPWFGVIVQWNGLDYAYQLLQLSKFDDSLPWRTIAEGITICAMQMQRVPGSSHDEYLGMYPDAYGALKGDEQYFFDINPRYISLCVFGLMGEDETTQTEILNASGSLIFISTVGSIGNSSYDGDLLTFDIAYPANDVSYATVGGVSRPGSVSVNGVPIPETADLGQVGQGWAYTPEGMLIVKVNHSLHDVVEVAGVTPQPHKRFSPEPIWEFNGPDSEGWSNTNMLAVLDVGNGTLSTSSTGNDPFMLGPSIRVPGRSDAVAQIRMRSSTGGQGQVFWVTKESPGYSESKSTHFEVLGDGIYHTYNLSIGQNPEWTGTIRQLRLDPVNIGGVDIEIDFIRIGESTTLMAILASLHFILLVGRSTKAGKASAGTLRGR